jgi:poly [ADP-ribose] polymerase
MDMLQVLGDMEVAQTLISQEEKQEAENPIDAKYKLLKNDVQPLDKKSDEYSRIETFLNNTKESWRLQLLDVYKVNREGEEESFKKFNDLEHRKLLWHGSKVAVFAAILTTGLKIMPHS